MLIPRRYVLDTPTVAGALHLAGVDPDPRLGWPAPAPGGDVGKAGLLDDGGDLTPEAVRALEIAARPERMVRIALARAGMVETAGTQLAWRSDGEGYVFWTPNAAGYDLAFVPTDTQAMLLVDELIQATDLPCRDGDGRAEIPAAAYAALLAAADSMADLHLRSRLDGTPLPREISFDAASLESAIEAAAARSDARRALSAAFAGLPFGPEHFRGRMGEGLAALDEAGLVEPDPSGPGPSAAGFLLIAALVQLVTTATISTQVLHPEGIVGLSPVTVFRAAEDILMAVWRRSAPDSTVLVAEVNASAVLGVIDGLLGSDVPDDARLRRPAPVPSAPPPAEPLAADAPPPPEPQAKDVFCTKCGARYPDSANRFCNSCGAPRAV